MRLVLERRAQVSLQLLILSPLVAVALTVIAGAVMFAALGLDPWHALHVYFVLPVSDSWGLQNIGAEGQFLMGAMAGGGVAIFTHGVANGPWLLPTMLLCGALGGALLALVPALLKTRFGANEILTSLMLVYVAGYLFDWLVRGPWRDPDGFNMPQTVSFEPEATMPLLLEQGRLNLGTPVAILVVIAAAILMRRTLKGFEIRLVGAAPRAARFAGFDDKKLTVTVFLLVAGVFVAITFIGGENAQITLGLPLDVARVIQGMLLFFVLACDSLVAYRVRRVPREAAA